MADALVPPPVAEQPQVVAPLPDDNQLVNVMTPEGDMASMPAHQVSQAVNDGFQVATDDQVQQHLLQSQYGGVGDQLKTLGEGALNSATLGAGPAFERALGVNPEDIRNRREANPVAHGLGQVAGLVGSSLAVPGGGAAGLMEGAGEAGAEALGLGAPASMAAKIGSKAVQAGIENAIFQGGDEAAKMLMGDPNQSVQTAVADVGLSGLIGAGIGGGLGAVSPLWKATGGGKLGSLLQGISDRTGGIEGVAPSAMDSAIQNAGINISPEVQAALRGNPTIQGMFQGLQESSTGAGEAAQAALRDFKTKAGDALIETLGRTPEQVAGLSELSENEAGAQLKKVLQQELKAKIDPISEQFNKVSEQFKGTELPQGTVPSMADQISQMSLAKGYGLSPSSEESRIINNVLKEIPNLKTLEDVRKYGSIANSQAASKQLWGLGKDLRQVFRNTEDSVLTSAIGEKAPELLSTHAAAREAYKDAMNTVDSLNDRLHVGKYGGPASFVKAVGEMAPKDVLRRLSPKGDAGIIGELQSKFPNTAKGLQDFHLDQTLKNAASKAAPGENISSKALFSSLERMSPEMRNFVVGPEAGLRMSSIKSLIDGLPQKLNTSGTAKALDKLWSHMPAAATGMASMVLGHSGPAGFLLGEMGKLLSRDVPDAAKLGLLKFLGSSKQVDGAAFKSMVDTIHSTIQGQNLIAKGTANIFKAGREVLPQSAMPNEKSRARLDKQLKALQVDPSPLLQTGADTGHYMPEHASAMAQTASQAVNYVNSLRPNDSRKSPLDPKPVVAPEDKAKFNRVLDIAEQPLTVLDKIKSGQLLPSDVVHLKNMYPDMYSKLSNKLTEQLTTAVDKGTEIPYKTKISLSVFLGQPLDSTMQPQAIQAAQAVSTPPAQAPMQPSGQTKGPHSMKALDKTASHYQTDAQRREGAEPGK